jgi:hypothetical protein
MSGPRPMPGTTCPSPRSGRRCFCGQSCAACWSESSLDDRHPGQPRDVGNDFRQFDIHLFQGLLHVLDMAGGVAHRHLPLSPVGTQRQHGIRRPKLKIDGVGAELPDWVGVTVGGDANHNRYLRLADADGENNKTPRAKRGIGNVCSLPNGINTMPGKPGMVSHQ